MKAENEIEMLRQMLDHVIHGDGFMLEQSIEYFKNLKGWDSDFKQQTKETI